jgi:hypothetical protein
LHPQKHVGVERQAQLPRMPKSQQEVFGCVNKLNLITNKEASFFQVSDEAIAIYVSSTQNGVLGDES